MKSALVLVVLLFTCSLAWAEESAPATEPLADQGGGCMLPDLTGLSPDQITAAALAAGFLADPTEVQVPPCPTTFSCSSITNCGAGSPCSITFLGRCCQLPSGLSLCCVSGNIKEIQCPCVCTGNPCAIVCGTSTDVSFHC